MFLQRYGQLCTSCLRPAAGVFRNVHSTGRLQKYGLLTTKTHRNLMNALASSARPTLTLSNSLLLSRHHACHVSSGTMIRHSSTSNGRAGTPSVGTENEVHVARIMMPDDGNPLSVVHGGVVLQIIEQAGFLCATKYCNTVPESNQPDYDPSACALVRIERMVFHKSIKIGEFVEAEAEVMFTAPHSMCVVVKIFSQNIFVGERRLTNQATLWYVPMKVHDLTVGQSVPPMMYPSVEKEIAGARAYQKQKQDRSKTVLDETEIDYNAGGQGEKHTVSYSQTNMCQLVLHSHCGPAYTSKSMGLYNSGRGSQRGEVLSITARPTFNSEKTLEVECLVDILDPFRGGQGRRRSIEAYFTFVSFDRADKHRRPQPMAPLKVTNKDEEARFQRCQEKYLERRKDRKHSQKP